MLTRRAALVASAATLLAAPAVAQADQTPPSFDDFLRKPALRGAALSPNGKRIAIAGEAWSDGKRTAYLDLINADAPDQPRSRTLMGDRDVEAVAWANDDRLLLWVVRDLSDMERKKEEWIRPEYKIRVRRLMSVTADGRSPAIMFGDNAKLNRSNYNLSYVVDMLSSDPDHILMRALDIESGRFNLYRVAVATGVGEIVERGGPQTYSWEIENGQPVLRWDQVGRGAYRTLMTRNETGDGWKPLRRVRQAEFVRPDFDLLGPAGQPGVFLVATRGDGDPAAAIREFDIRTGQLGAVVAQRPTLDVSGAIFDQAGKYVGAEYVEDRVAYDFAERKLGPHIRGIESFFAKECNVRIVDMSRDRNRFVMLVSGPRLPGAYYYYDLQAANLQNLGLHKPWLEEARLAKVEALDILTRDGVKLRGYLTQPLAAGPRPLIVMPHGGPEARDSFDYDHFAQIFAGQGWLVLQVNFRGSDGYGREFADAGRRRWGDRMQEDLDDAVAQVLASGRADPKKVAIWGASYGGYAALMGAARNPDLYRCAVSVAGVTDLPRMLEDERSDGADSPIYEYWVRTIGDPKADAAAIAAASPSRRAEQIKAPILLIHGLDDGVVLPNQSRLMADALKAARRHVQHLEIRGMGHSRWEDDDERNVLATSINFIAATFA